MTGKTRKQRSVIIRETTRPHPRARAEVSRRKAEFFQAGGEGVDKTSMTEPHGAGKVQDCP